MPRWAVTDAETTPARPAWMVVDTWEAETDDDAMSEAAERPEPTVVWVRATPADDWRVWWSSDAVEG